MVAVGSAVQTRVSLEAKRTLTWSAEANGVEVLVMQW